MSAMVRKLQYYNCFQLGRFRQQLVHYDMVIIVYSDLELLA